jgi:hypothetical protein
MAILQSISKVYSQKNHVSGSGRKPFINGSKGEGQTPSRGRGLQGRKRRQRPCCRFFLLKAASCRPVANTPQQCVLRPPRLPSYIMLCVIRPTASKRWYPAPKLPCLYLFLLLPPTACRRPSGYIVSEIFLTCIPMCYISSKLRSRNITPLISPNCLSAARRI